MAKIKKRLDNLVHERYPQYSRRQIQSWIMQGKVSVNDVIETKGGSQVDEKSSIVLQHDEPDYVSRAGYKLENVLDHFDIDVTGLICLDAGISTGGFTDCLLQRGAHKVYGIDVGYGQVHEKIANNERLVLMERTNLRYLREDDLGQSVDLVTLDLSFISLLKVMEAICLVLKDDGDLITLIKPQFEASKHDIGRGGIIKDSDVHQHVIKRVTQGIQAYGFTYIGVIESPIRGTQGNKEFLAYFKRSV